MNKIILLLILGFPLFCSSQSWADHNSVWYYEQTDFGPPFNSDFIKFSEIGDTVILGDSAKIIIRQYITSSDTISNDIFMKSDSNRVYIYVSETNLFELIYDFNALPGDTIRVYCGDGISPGTAIQILVDSVSTININDNILKVQYVSQPNFEDCFMSGTIIENIGWTGYMFPMSSIADPPTGGSLRCFQNDVIGLYQLTDFDCDYISTDIESFGELNKIQVFPNPTDGIVQINALNIERVEVINLEGKCWDFEAKNEIDLSNLEQGVYMLKVSTSYEIIIRKIVLTRSN